MGDHVICEKLGGIIGQGEMMNDNFEDKIQNCSDLITHKIINIFG